MGAGGFVLGLGAGETPGRSQLGSACLARREGDREPSEGLTAAVPSRWTGRGDWLGLIHEPRSALSRLRSVSFVVCVYAVQPGREKGQRSVSPRDSMISRNRISHILGGALGSDRPRIRILDGGGTSYPVCFGPTIRQLGCSDRNHGSPDVRHFFSAPFRPILVMPSPGMSLVDDEPFGVFRALRGLRL